jgi:hypothetical protein
LCQPHGFGFQADVDFNVAGLGLVDEELGFCGHGFILHGLIRYDREYALFDIIFHEFHANLS